MFNPISLFFGFFSFWSVVGWVGVCGLIRPSSIGWQRKWYGGSREEWPQRTSPENTHTQRKTDGWSSPWGRTTEALQIPGPRDHRCQQTDLNKTNKDGFCFKYPHRISVELQDEIMSSTLLVPLNFKILVEISNFPKMPNMSGWIVKKYV